MRFSFEVGQQEKHRVEFNWGKFLGVAKIWVDGELVLKSKPLAHRELSQLSRLRGVTGSANYLGGMLNGSGQPSLTAGWSFEIGAAKNDTLFTSRRNGRRFSLPFDRTPIVFSWTTNSSKNTSVSRRTGRQTCSAFLRPRTSLAASGPEAKRGSSVRESRWILGLQVFVEPDAAAEGVLDLDALSPGSNDRDDCDDSLRCSAKCRFSSRMASDECACGILPTARCRLRHA